MRVNLIAGLVVLLAPLAVAAVQGLWLTLLGWLGLPLLLGQLRVSTDSSRRIVRTATPIASLVVVGATLAIYYLGPFPWELFDVDALIAGTLLDWVAGPPLIWSVLAVLGPLAVISCLPSTLGLPGGAAQGSRRVAGIVMSTLLLIGLCICLVGHGWPISIAIVDPNGLRDRMRSDHFLSPVLFCFAPLNLVAAVLLPRWLKLPSDKRLRIAKGIAIAMAVAGVLGGVLSALYIRAYWW